MYQIGFYEDERGREPVKIFLRELGAKTDKDSQINVTKIREYILAVKRKGTYAGKPFVKHIKGDLWELRPLQNRIFFFCFNGDTIVLLHQFVKKTQKTPRKEIQKAMKHMENFRRKHNGRS